MFDEIAELYDALIDWPARLAREAPFYRRLFARSGARRVLDAACGTGRHAGLFHEWGLAVEGADLSPAMIARARETFGPSDTRRWQVRSFDQPVPGEPFDVALCIGNSLALAPDHAAAGRALRNLLAAVRPGGAAVVQVLNLWSLPDGPCVWQKFRRLTLGGREHLVIKGVHRAGSRGFVELISVLPAAEDLRPRIDSTPFLGLTAAELAQHAAQAGARVELYGDWSEAAYEPERSPDLILVAQK